MAEESKLAVGQELAELQEMLPADVMNLPLENLSPAEVLGRVSLKGLYRLDELLTPPVTDEMDVKEKRLIGEMALGAGRMFIRAAGEDWRRKEADRMAELLREIQAEKGRS